MKKWLFHQNRHWNTLVLVNCHLLKGVGWIVKPSLKFFNYFFIFFQKYFYFFHLFINFFFHIFPLSPSYLTFFIFFFSISLFFFFLRHRNFLRHQHRTPVEEANFLSLDLFSLSLSLWPGLECLTAILLFLSLSLSST